MLPDQGDGAGTDPMAPGQLAAGEVLAVGPDGVNGLLCELVAAATCAALANWRVWASPAPTVLDRTDHMRADAERLGNLDVLAGRDTDGVRDLLGDAGVRVGVPVPVGEASAGGAVGHVLRLGAGAQVGWVAAAGCIAGVSQNHAAGDLVPGQEVGQAVVHHGDVLTAFEGDVNAAVAVDVEAAIPEPAVVGSGRGDELGHTCFCLGAVGQLADVDFAWWGHAPVVAPQTRLNVRENACGTHFSRIFPV